MLLHVNPTLETVDPEILVQAMERFVSSCAPQRLEGGILKSIPTLDDWHRGALARAITNDELFADVSKMDASTLQSAVRLSNRGGELPGSFLQFLKANPRALEQLDPGIAKGIFANINASGFAFDEAPLPRPSRDVKVAASAVLATLLLGGAGVVGLNAFRSNAERVASPVILAPAAAYTTQPATIEKTRIVARGPVDSRKRVVGAQQRPLVERVIIRQIIVKRIAAQPARSNGKAGTPAGMKPVERPSAPKRIAAKPTVAKHNVPTPTVRNITARRPQPAPQMAVNAAALAPARPAGISVAQPAAPISAPVVPPLATPAPALTARDFVASTIKTATPDSQISALWVSQGGANTTIVEAESTSRGGTFYDKYVVLPISGGFSIASHEQIPVSAAAEHSTASPSPSVARAKRALFGHLRPPHRN